MAKNFLRFWGGEMQVLGRKSTRWVAVAAAFVLVVVFAVSTNISAQVSSQRPGDVFRGLIDTGIWVELAHDGGGMAELAVLDGLPGEPAETRFFRLQRAASSAGCILQSPDGFITVTPCPTVGSFAAEVSIGGARGRATLTSVGWGGSFAWGQASTRPTDDIRAACRMPQLAGFAPIAQTGFRRTIGTIASETSSLPQRSDQPGDLARLRADRLRVYSVLALTPQEAQELQRVEDAVAGRPVLGRPVPLAQATRDQAAFNERVFNSPARRRGREELLQIDRSLSAIYDPLSAAQRSGLLARVRDERLPTALNDLRQMLVARQPGSIDHLIGLETAISDLDQCSQAVRGDGSNGARAQVRAAMAERASEIVTAMRNAIATAGGSTGAASALQRYDSSPGVREALRMAGLEGALAQAQAQVRQVAAAEEQARIAGEREAARQAAADRIAPTTPGGRFAAERVARSVVRIVVLNGENSSTGSGFIVAPEVLVTNNHVIRNAPGGRVFVIGNERRVNEGVVGQVIRAYPEYDIAIVRAPNLQGRVVALAGGDPRQGVPSYAFGFPGAVDERGELAQVATLTDGIVSRVAIGPVPSSRIPISLVQHTAEVSPGNSGGPLFDNCHRVIGVNTFVDTSDQRTGARYLFAVSSSILPELLRSNGVEPQVAAGGCN